MKKAGSGLIAGFALFAGLALFLALNRHSKSGVYNYHSEIWADKAGYYVYLPAAFLYHFDPSTFPAGIDKKTGSGFQLDTIQHKVRTKYTCGLAILQAPFFAGALIAAHIQGLEGNGFSTVFQKAVDVAAVFYFLAGCLFLYGFLAHYFSRRAVIITLLALFLCTNLYYYAIADTGMSHIYSFCLFSAFLFISNRLLRRNNASTADAIILGSIAGLIILIRPLNILFLTSIFFLDLQNMGSFRSRVSRLITPRFLLIAVVTASFVFIPQLMYWHYLTGNWIMYSYGKEGFSNWNHPQLASVWFAPVNGLFLYTPFFSIILVSMIYLLRQKRNVGIYTTLIFLLLSYLCASWWNWYFGCAYGARNFVEYYALFSFSLCFLIDRMVKKKGLPSLGFWTIVVLLAALNLKMVYSYDGCFYGSDWDWKAYLNLVLSPPK